MEKSDRSSNADNDCLLDEAHLALGTAALYCKDTNSALHHYGIVNSAHGVYKQCKVKILIDHYHVCFAMLLGYIEILLCYYYTLSHRMSSIFKELKEAY